MFRTKKDVDRHSQEVLKKLKTEKERNLRCLSIAQQYYNVHDYESAKRYVLMYLSVKDDNPLAHKLLAQCHEQFSEKGKALQEYINSLEIDSKQPELILKVCELLADDDAITDKSMAKQWCDTGEKQFPYHATVLKLKKKLMLIDDSNYSTVEAVLNGEVKTKPNDAEVHTRFLSFYIENGRVKEAYEEAFNRTFLFTPTIQWYQCAVKICKAYKGQYPNALKEEFYANNLLSLERLLGLAVQDVKITRKSIPECVSFLARFDETLSDAVLLVNKSIKFQQIINHMCGQLCFHTANILYRKLIWEDSNSQELNQLVSPLLLLSTSKEFKITEDRTSNDTLSRIYNICVIHNAYRILQTGFVLNVLAKESPKQFIEKIFHICVANYWKQTISEKVFSTSDFKTFRKSSFFMTYSAFSNLPSDLPTLLSENMERNINITEHVNPMSLHHLVWLGVNYIGFSDKKSLCDMSLSYQFYSRKFNSLPFSHQLITSYPESLCRIDVDAFLYACVFSAKSYVDQQTISDKYRILPADVSKNMCSPEQEQWWECVHQMCSKTIPENTIPRSRSTLQRGIEAIRLSGNNSLPVPLLVLLGRTFSNRAAVESDSDKASALEERAALYWKTALPLLEKVARNEMSLGSQKSMFEFHRCTITKAEAVKLVEEGKRIVGMHLIKENDYSESICEQVNESYGDFNSTMSSNFVSNTWGEKIIQTLVEQNTKITDKLETLFNKQELLCSNQFQLLEMISTLTKKVEDFMLPDYDEYLDKLQSAQPSCSQNAAPAGTQSNVGFSTSFPLSTPSNFTNSTKIPEAPGKTQFMSYLSEALQTSFPLKPPANPYPMPLTPFASIPPKTQFQMPTWEPVVHALAKSEPEYDVANLSSYTTSYSTGLPATSYGTTLPAMNTTSFIPSTSPWLSTLNTSSFPPNFLSPQTSLFAVKQQQIIPATSLASYSGSIPTGTVSSSFSSNVAKTTTVAAGTPSSTSFASPKTPSTSFSVPKTNTPSTPTHSFHIPIPENSTIVQSPSVEVPEDDDDDVQPVEHDPLPDFKPIIPLPDEVDVKTGEENEDVLYQNRVRLFRFVDKEWKERGIGIYKLLKNPETGKIRALMRREMVHKVCANHLLTEDMTLTPMKASDRAWIYSAADFADEQVKMEQFCIKFKNVDEANKFKDEFIKCKLQSAKSPVKPIVESKSPASVANTTPKRNVAGIEIEKKEPPKSNTFTFGAKLNASKTELIKPASNTFTFGSAFDANKIEKTKSETKSPFAGFTGFSSNTLQTNSMANLFQAKNLPPSDTIPRNADESAPFAAVTNTVDFSNLSNSGNAFTKSKNFKGFDGAGSLVFGSLANSPKASIAPPVAAILKNVEKSPAASNEAPVADGSNNLAGPSLDLSLNDSVAVEAEEDFVPTQEFSPVIPLPDLVEVKTGEEGLKVLFEDRCKLFRYTGKEWKERGIGPMKILLDPKDGSVRLLMRREQVHKLCCNHRLTKEHELKPHALSDKAWTWCAQDYSEGELKNETFCIRFKTNEQAKAFYEVFNQAKCNAELPKKAVAESTTKDSKETLPKLSEMFKKESGSWECKMCYVMNKKDIDTCVSCASPKNPSEQKSTSAASSLTDSKFSFASKPPNESKFSFGMPPSTGAKPVENSTFAFGMPKESSTADPKADGFKFTFGSTTTSTVSSTTSSATFSFGNSSAPSVFSFGTDPTATSAQSKDSKSTFSPVVSQSNAGVETSSTFTPIASQSGATKSVFAFGNSTPNAPLFTPNESASVAKSESKDAQNTSSVSRFSFSSNKPLENASIFGSAKSDSTPTFSFGKQEENASIFGSANRTANTSIFGTPDSFKSENTSGAYMNFSFKLDNKPLPASDKSESAQGSTPIYQRVPYLINDMNDVTLFKSHAKLYSSVEDIEEELGNGSLSILKNSNTNKVRLFMMREPGYVACLNHYLEVGMNFDKFDQHSWLWKASDFSRWEIFEGRFRAVFDDAETAALFKNTIDQAQKEIEDNANDSPSSSEVEFISETKTSKEERELAEKLQLPSNYFAYKYVNDCPGCVGCDQDDIKQRKEKENKENQATSVFQSNVSSGTSSNSSIFSGFNNPAGDSKPNLVFGDVTNSNTSSWLNKGPFKIGDVFGKTSSEVQNSPSQKTTTEDGSDDDDDSVVKNDQDPYFEPVVPLPDIVEVKTGEENEEIKFCERGKLFRYSEDSKEWKERGVGDLKILFHPMDKTYRLLLRREQVHKVVLNQRISTSFNVQPLSTNKNSWCWFGMNLPEEQSEPVVEKLAIKFKTESISNKFSEMIQECLFELDSSQRDQSQSQDADKQNDPSESEDKKTTSDGDDERDYGEDTYSDHLYDVYQEYVDGDDEYEPDYYVDEQAISEAMEEIEGESLFEKEVHVEVLDSDTIVEYDGVINLLKKYDDEKGDNIGCMVFSTNSVTALYKTDITEGMNMISEGNGSVAFLELNSDDYEKKMILHFEDEANAEEFITSFRNLNVPTM